MLAGPSLLKSVQLACRMATLMIAILSCVPPALCDSSSASVFLSSSELEKLVSTSKSLTCEEVALSLQGSRTQHKTIATASITSTLQAHTSEQRQLTRDSLLGMATGMKFLLPSISIRDETLEMMSVSGTTSVLALHVKTTSPADLICLEMLLHSGNVNVLVLFAELIETSLQLYHDVPFLEQHFGLPLPIPSVSIIEIFQDKSRFASWMAGSGMADFIPRVYSSTDAVSYPVMIKATSKGGGNGIYIAHDQHELNTAIRELKGATYVLQEPIEGKTEPVLYYIARHGKLVATVCLLNRQKSQLFVAGADVDFSFELVSCEAFEIISPMLDLTRHIVEASSYNGIGCINFKFVPVLVSGNELEEYMNDIPTISHSDASVVLTTFVNLRSSQDLTVHDAIPKLFEINPRPGGSMMGVHTPELALMMKAFLLAAADEVE